MALKIQELPGGGGLIFIINNAKLLLFKQNNFSIYSGVVHQAF